MRRLVALSRIALLPLAVLVTGCIPPPADIGVDYSGPLPRKAGADAPRVVTNAPVLPVMTSTECAPVTEVPTRRRSECGVRQVMARYNPGLQALYQRRLAEDPFLKGRVALQMNILPDGSVQAVDVASSDIDDPELAQQISAYVRTISFGALDSVPPWSDTYTLEFAPPKEQGAETPQPAATN
jgi:hypothetical protein